MSSFVVRHGNPSPEELGVVVSVLSAAVASRTDSNVALPTPLRNWAGSQLNRPLPLRRGRGAWTLAGRLR